MAVTPDKYELPVNITETAKEMSEWLGVTRNAIYMAISQNLTGQRSGFKIVRIKI